MARAGPSGRDHLIAGAARRPGKKWGAQEAPRCGVPSLVALGVHPHVHQPQPRLQLGDYVSRRVGGAPERGPVPLPFRVVLTIGDMDRAGALRVVARDAVAREMVEPKIADLDARHFLDAKASDGGQRSDQPSPMSRDRVRTMTKQPCDHRSVDRQLEGERSIRDRRKQASRPKQRIRRGPQWVEEDDERHASPAPRPTPP